MSGVAEVEGLAKLLAKYNIPGRQLRLLYEAYARRGVDAFKRLLKQQAARGLIPPEVIKALIDSAPSREEFSQACRLVDYEFIKPLTELWNETCQELDRLGVKLELSTIRSVRVLRREHNRVVIELKVERGATIDVRALERAYGKVLSKELGREFVVHIKLRR